MSKIEPPSDAEFEEMIVRYEREQAIPFRVDSIEKWIRKIKATPDDVRNIPDNRQTKDGRWFLAKITDLDEILKHCATTRQHCTDGKFELALSSLRSLNSRVNEVNSRRTALLIATGKKIRDASKRGGRKNQYERQMARDYIQERKTSHLSNSALAEKIGRRYRLKGRSGAIAAVKRSMKKYCPQSGEEDT